MSWVRVDDGFCQHPKVQGCSDRAFRLHVAGICYCARNLTDGFIAAGAVRMIAATANIHSPSKVVAQLVDLALWHRIEGGWEINGYLDYNPSAEQVKEERRKAAERMRNLRSSGGSSPARSPARSGGSSGTPSRPYMSNPPKPPLPPADGLACNVCGIRKPTAAQLDDHLRNVHGLEPAPVMQLVKEAP
jgi:hypothetical protein